MVLQILLYNSYHPWLLDILSKDESPATSAEPQIPQPCSILWNIIEKINYFESENIAYFVSL